MKTTLLGKAFLLTSLASFAHAAETNPLIEAAKETPGKSLQAAIAAQASNANKMTVNANLTENSNQQASTVATELALSRIGVSEDVTAETTELFGEKVDLNTGAVSFSQTDISLPGNFPIDVGVTRVHRSSMYSESQLIQFADWQLDIPSITTTVVDGIARNNTWTNGKACSGPLNPGSVDIYGDGFIVANQYWSADTISVPGVGSERLLEPTTPTAGVTRVAKNWKIQCVTVGNQEQFKATSPQGVTYTFGKLRLVRAEDIVLSTTDRETGATLTRPVARYNAFMQVTEIRDRFNNTVTYNYSSPDQLDSIVASDGRQINFVYELGSERKRVKSITANGKTWNYFYRVSSSPKWVNGIAYNVDIMHKVVLPDGREWVYEDEFVPTSALDARWVKYSYGDSQQDDIQCTFSPSGDASNAHGIPHIHRMTHPSGLTAEFELQPALFGRTQLPHKFQSTKNRINKFPRCFANLSIKRKTLSGKGVPALSWNYSYSQNPGQYVDGAGDFGPAPAPLSGIPVVPSGYNAMDLRSTSVVAPDGSKTIHVFDRRYNYSQDQEVATFQYDTDGTTLLQRTEHKYVLANQVGIADLTSHTYSGSRLITTAESFENEAQHNSFVNKSQTQIHRYVNGVATDSYTTQYSSYNNYGVPLITKEFNNVNGKVRYTRDSYQHDLTNWVLNLPTDKELSSNGTAYTSVRSTSYYSPTHASKSLPYQEFSSGLLQATNTYLADGNLSLKTFNATNRWVQYSNYKRGKPQLIKVPTRYSATCTDPSMCFQSVSATVNNDGNISWVRDFNNNETYYGYDPIGRLTSINPVDSRWADTSISYDVDYSGDASMVQNVSRGNFRKSVTLDGLYRAILSKEWDVTDEANTVRYTRQEFNAYGKPTFASQPSRSAFENLGSSTAYDGLQRVSQQTNTANGDISFDYLAGNVVQSTNGRNYQTNTQYLAYGSPEQELAIFISQPESVDTSISYNLFGNPVSITQGGVVESRVYDSAQRLCLQKRPETGIKALQYNNLGQITGYAEGLTGNGSSCSDYTTNTNAWVAIAYDNHGVERGKTFADGSPAVTNTLDAQGNLLTLAAGNSTWTYTYNSKNLVESELLNVAGVNFVLNPEYDSLGNLASLQYNNQLTASYAPNALGQPMQLTDGFATLASQVQYHPDGKLKSFNYGNGLRFNQSLDTENRPYERAVLQSQSYRVAQRYGYDANNNIEAITDLVASNRSVNMQYDGLDRLDNATGAWGYGSFDYDVLGNLTAKTVGSTTSYYNYNTTTNRLSSVTGGYNFSYDDRGNVSNNGKRAFTFNRANQLVGSGNVSYVYDGYNRRVRQQTAAGTNYSLYNSGGQLMLRQNPAAMRTFALYLGKDLIAERDISTTANTVRYQHTDVLGSVIAESNSAGAITSSSVYQPFGERVGGQKVGVGFTGHLEDPDIELTYMQQRYYDPVIGRFYSNDPVGFGADNPMMFNRYAYANNNPYKYVDPDGNAPEIKISLPTETGKVTSNFNPKRVHPVTNEVKNHRGTDFEAPINTAIFSTEKGTVLSMESDTKFGGGNQIWIQNESGSISGYSHTGSIKGMQVGDSVESGQKIGISDGSGKHSGPHLHYTYIPGTVTNPATMNGTRSDPVKTQLKGMVRVSGRIQSKKFEKGS